MEFNLLISLNLPNRKIPYGRFLLGKDANFANELFLQLKGKPDGTENHNCIKIELSEEILGLPVPIAIRSCTLDELKENVSIISKEIFRIAHLEDGADQILS
ncbi:hypothetical protein [Pedobacter jamesrossensis]|uniref:Uncharacterized protein n=1 Tax=Pedobacter jamesrossensis TaxID=1908238 RepID=A0ABV8NP32_9SPHI